MNEFHIPQIGIYYYPWYNAARWKLHPKKNIPAVGEYNSGDTVLIQHHIQQLQNLNIDYVIIEMLPINDWDFKNTFQATLNFINILNSTSIKYTFLIDTAVGTGHKDSCSYFNNLINVLKKHSLIPTKIKNNKPLLFFFSTTLHEAMELITKYGKEFFIVFPIFLPDWDTPDDTCNEVMRARGYHFPTGTTRKISLVHAGYIPFWMDTGDIFASNGFTAIIPGYDDLLLKRSPQLAPVVPRKNGHTLVEQFKKAIISGAEDILLYSWNEYFEATNIEPTLQCGNFYFDLTKELIRQLKNKEPIHFPEKICALESISPVYLSSEIKRRALMHADTLPPWDKEFYLAKIQLPKVQFLEHIEYRGIIVCNIGIRAWEISEITPIRLGARIYDANGNPVIELRAEFSKKHISPGEKVYVNLSINPHVLSPGKYKIILGVVHEGRCWFDKEVSDTLFLDINNIYYKL